MNSPLACMKRIHYMEPFFGKITYNNLAFGPHYPCQFIDYLERVSKMVKGVNGKYDIEAFIAKA